MKKPKAIAILFSSALLILCMLAPMEAIAEYRAYQYLVFDKVTPNGAQPRGLITSTLDPRTYIAYNGGNGLVNVDLLRTWICPGHTGKKTICESPYGALPQIEDDQGRESSSLKLLEETLP